LRRHGAGHRIPPHRVNYRANLWALRQAGVARIVACAAVGGIDRALPVGGLVVPEQLIDATWGRAHTFFDGASGELDALGDLQHIDFSRPYSEKLRADLLAAARRAGVAVAPAGVYAVTQGPRLETAAEIDALERGGASIVGMTGMPEAALARELGIKYATLAIVVNPAAGRAPARIDMAGIAAHIEAGAAKALAVLAQL
ncbi:MAG: S-methyl-5'-thioinosine phosphorylase, partial [Gammaproteobacteria bacterium]|nr:S-methyl-5'-thioinosine phosphorylase [Gammaproteobacteria bacterium]